MAGIAVQSEDSAGGAQLAGGQDFVRVGGKRVVVLGDPVEPHGDPPHSPRPFMTQGSSFVTIAGIPVCREGHAASCGHPTTGRDWVQIDD